MIEGSCVLVAPRRHSQCTDVGAPGIVTFRTVAVVHGFVCQRHVQQSCLHRLFHP